MENKTKQITDQDFVKWFHKNKETMSFILGNFQKTHRQKRGVTLEEMITTFIIGFGLDRKSTRLNSSHIPLSRMPSSA